LPFSILFAYLINPVVRFLQRHSLFFKKPPRGRTSLEAYLALIVFTLLLSHGLFPQFRKSAGPASGGNPYADGPSLLRRKLPATSEVTSVGLMSKPTRSEFSSSVIGANVEPRLRRQSNNSLRRR